MSFAQIQWIAAPMGLYTELVIVIPRCELSHGSEYSVAQTLALSLYWHLVNSGTLIDTNI